jgi:hypothetical protein
MYGCATQSTNESILYQPKECGSSLLFYSLYLEYKKEKKIVSESWSFAEQLDTKK